MLIVAGPAGSGKTTVGRAVADCLGWTFVDADDYHSAASRHKMARGEGLTDADRAPWLARLAALVRGRTEGGPPTVLAASALKRRYRTQLLVPGASLVWLSVSAETLRQRLTSRQGHIAGVDLLASQLSDAEPPGSDEGAVVKDAEQPLEELVRSVQANVHVPSE